MILSSVSIRSFISLFFVILILQSPFLQSGLSNFLKPSDTFNSKRIWLAGGICFTSYSIFSIGLYNAWYKKSNLNSFHLFNDFGEWNQVDKVAHSYNSYLQSSICYDGAIWCGIPDRNAILWGVGIAMLFQSTIEVMDGFSQDYGFSAPDICFNILGCGLFAGQQLLWQEQKFKLKLSALPKHYPDRQVESQLGNLTSLKQRALDLYGAGYFNSVLKDYNAQTFWLSFNPHVLIPSLIFEWPAYLNIAVGYGADGIYGGYKNEWRIEDDYYYFNDEKRIRQYYLSLDIDLKKIKTKNRFLKTTLGILNIIKIPAPAVEYNSLGKLKWHWLFF